MTGSSLSPKQLRDRDAQIWRRVNAGETMASIAKDLGLTRERVRQIVNRMDGYDGRGLSPTAKLRQNQRHQRMVQDRRRRAQTVRCPTCLCWHTVLVQMNRQTCSPACATAWRQARWLLDPERAEQLRVHKAQANVRYQHRVSPVQVDHARQLLTAAADGRRVPPNRYFVVPHKRAWRLILEAHHGVYSLARRRIEITMSSRRSQTTVSVTVASFARATLGIPDPDITIASVTSPAAMNAP